MCSSSLRALVDEGRKRQQCPNCGWIHYRNPTVGVAVILIRKGMILLGRRKSGDWCIPCGHVEWDENIREAAIREAQEETNLDVTLERLYEVHSNFHNPDQHTVGVWFLAQAKRTEDPQAGGDLVEVDWFSPNKPPLMAFPTDQLILERLAADFALLH
jgi:ADP-ribose pyrophosphatase YjhB (NUDIX family)